MDIKDIMMLISTVKGCLSSLATYDDMTYKEKNEQQNQCKRTEI